MKMQWFRLYAEFAYDPKVQCLSETLQRRYIMLLCVTCNNELQKMTSDELAFTLRIGESDLETTLIELKKHRLIDDNNHPIGWNKRQYISDTSTERVKKHREMKRISNVTETFHAVTVTPPDTDTDTDTDTDKKENKGRGTRFALQDPPVDWVIFCQTQRPDLDAGKTFDSFHDFWIAKPGQAGTKLDWTATWRNWVRNQKGEIYGQQSKSDRAKQAILRGLASAEGDFRSKEGFSG